MKPEIPSFVSRETLPDRVELPARPQSLFLLRDSDPRAKDIVQRIMDAAPGTVLTLSEKEWHIYANNVVVLNV